jgi:hypothetical protein
MKQQRARRIDVSLAVFVSSPGAVVLLVVSLTVFVSVPGPVVLFVLVVTAGLDGSFLLSAITTTTAIMAATATKTDPIKMTLNFRDILDQPCASLTSGAGIGKAS